MKTRNDRTIDLRTRKHLSFGFYVGETPPLQTRTGNSPYGGIWERIEELPICDQDTEVGGVVVPAGCSPWARVEMADRLEARRAATSLRNYVSRTGAEYAIQTMYNDDQASVHVRKVALGRNGNGKGNGHG